MKLERERERQRKKERVIPQIKTLSESKRETRLDSDPASARLPARPDSTRLSTQWRNRFHDRIAENQNKSNRLNLSRHAVDDYGAVLESGAVDSTLSLSVAPPKSFLSHSGLGDRSDALSLSLFERVFLLNKGSVKKS